MPKSKKNNTKKRQQGARANQVQSLRFGPPQLKTNVVIRHTFRFLARTGATSSGITASQILGICGNICDVANTAVVSIAGSAKVHSVSVWSPVAAQGAGATCSVEWRDAGGANAFASEMESSDTSISVSQPAHIRTTPPKESGAAFWFGASANILFVLTAPVASIVDVDLSFILNDSGSAGVPATVATGALGVNYWLALDGTTNHFYQPVSLTTTF